MTAKKPAAAKKKAAGGGKAGAKAGGKVADLIDAPVRSDAEVAEIVDRRTAKAERWAEAWRMHVIGVPYRVIAQRMGLSDHKEAIRYVRNHERLVDGDPDRVSDRAEVVARYDLAVERMLAELTVLEGEEQRRAREAEAAGDRYVPGPVWLEKSGPLLKALEAKWRVVAPHSPQKQVTVELGAAVGAGGSGMPAALAGVIATVTVTDNEDAA